MSERWWDSELDAVLVLEDGRCFEGTSFGARRASVGEIVFNTSMSGYQEILTDPSYAGQLVAMTYPHIGNYGVAPQDMESSRIWAAGLIVRSVTERPSNWRAQMSLPAWLAEQGVPGISGVDTRALTRHIRDKGVMKAIIAPGKSAADRDALLAQMAAAPDYGDEDFVSAVMTSGPMRVAFDEGAERYGEDVSLAPLGEVAHEEGDARPHVVVLDFGAKHSILRHLASRGCRVTLAPSTTPPDAIRALRPDGILLSNGPGDPALLDALGARLDEVVREQPTYAICLGHQVLARAVGAETFKLPFGHRGPNQPVKEVATGRISMTSQNHGYAVDQGSMPEELEVTHVNLNDDTVAGFRHRDRAIVAVQYHPEAGPGPHDAVDFFDDFIAAARDHARG